MARKSIIATSRMAGRKARTTSGRRILTQAALRSRQTGFSLAEIIVVLVLIAGVVTIFSVGIARSVSSAEIRNASREIVAGIRHTRGQAIVQREQQVFMVDGASRTWQAANRSPVELPDGLEIEMLTARSELTSERAGGIRFYPDGSSTGGSVTLLMQDREWTINVAWLTGEVSLERDD